MVQATIEKITPEAAVHFLAHGVRNRPINKIIVREYARAMRENRWKVNGESLIFTSDNRLLDGKHRISACIEADVAFNSLVVRGINSDAFDTINIGKKRSAADILTIEGCRNAAAVAGALQWVKNIPQRIPSLRNNRLSADEVLVSWRETPEIEIVVSKIHHLRSILQPAIAGALYFLLEKKDAAFTERFFEQLGTGADLPAEHPVLVLRNRLLKIRSFGSLKHGSPSPGEIVSLCIRAWNHCRAGRDTKVLKGLVKKDDGTLVLPVIE